MSNFFLRQHIRFEGALAQRADLGPLILRVVIGGHLIWSMQDNVFSWARMLEFRDFLDHYGFPWPLFCAVLSVAAQFLCGIAFVLGAWVRLAGLIMVFNFAVAIVMVDGTQPYPAAFAALAVLAAALSLSFTGAGRWAVDRGWRRTAADPSRPG